MIFKFDKTLFKWQLIVFFSKLLSAPEYTYAWYVSAIKVRKEDFFK
jgi:hypothetical protein